MVFITWKHNFGLLQDFLFEKFISSVIGKKLLLFELQMQYVSAF